MKNSIKIKQILLSAVSAFVISSCSANKLPKIKNPEYSIFNLSGEKGFDVSFEVNGKGATPSAVVINRIKQQIPPQNTVGHKYNVRVLAQSSRMFGFRPNVTDKENGIYFKTDSTEVFKEVKFILKEK